ncbi:MAG: PEGA domain-containing protein, partial [Sandaracinaceae bacterium]|nr:PEGA domain-containing protein [Sandaracinaceae bacterium]
MSVSSSVDAQQSTVIPISIESTPPGATVYLDSTATPPLGVTPLQNVRLRRGQATFIFQLENHEEERLVVNINKRREVFRAVLSPLSTIVVTAGNADAEGAAVRIDGEPVGNVPFQMNVKPGRHLVQVGREGFKTFSQWVDLGSAQSITVPALLEREAPKTGAILVVGDSPGAKILIDGEPKGETPQLIEGIPEGERVVEIVSDREGASAFRERIRVIAGERITLNPTLIREAEK